MTVMLIRTSIPASRQCLIAATARSHTPATPRNASCRCESTESMLIATDRIPASLSRSAVS